MDFSTLQTKVNDYLNRGDLTSIVPSFIQLAQKKLERNHNYRCMEVRATAVLPKDQYLLGLPTNRPYKEAKSMLVLDTTKYFLVERTTLENARVQYPDYTNNVGRPIIFATDSAQNSFLIRPTADKNYTVDMFYYAYTTELSAGTDTNWWTINAWEILLYGALLEASVYLIDDARVQVWATLYKDARDILIKQEIDESISGSGQYVKADFIV